jgi:RNA polymerase sigma-70 factor (ECF subfamily)
MDENALIESARCGNLDAFNQIVLAYQGVIYRHALGLLRVKEDAEDASQEAFILAFRKLGTFRGGTFRAWLLRIVHNLCYDELRRRKRKQTEPLNPYNREGEEIESPAWLIDPSELPEDQAEKADLYRILRAYVNELQPDYRMVVFLVDLEGLDYREAATILKVPLGTVKSRLARARLELYHRLRPAIELTRGKEVKARIPGIGFKPG